MFFFTQLQMTFIFCVHHLLTRSLHYTDMGDLIQTVKDVIFIFYFTQNSLNMKYGRYIKRRRQIDINYRRIVIIPRSIYDSSDWARMPERSLANPVLHVHHVGQLWCACVSVLVRPRFQNAFSATVNGYCVFITDEIRPRPPRYSHCEVKAQIEERGSQKGLVLLWSLLSPDAQTSDRISRECPLSRFVLRKIGNFIKHRNNNSIIKDIFMGAEGTLVLKLNEFIFKVCLMLYQM